MARNGLLGDAVLSGRWAWTWSGGESAGSVSYVADAREVSLVYTSTTLDGRREEHRPRITVEWTPCTFGGRRAWFRCPRCGRRCAVVYVRRTTACRGCHRLAYASQREDASQRAHRRGRKLMERLGVKGQDAWDLALDPWQAPKPPRMRWATYKRIVTAADDAEEARVAALLPGMKRLLRRFTG